MFKASNFNPNAGSSVSKIFNPGTHYCRIAEIRLDAPPYKPESYFVVLTLVGLDRGDDFVGMAIDKTRPELGNYKGQVATVKSGRYSFSDYTYDGRQITRDEQIFRWVNNLAKQMGVLEKMNADNVEAETIEDYVAIVRRYLLNPELYGYFTIAGQEYFTEGYDRPNYRLFFPKQEGKNLPFSAVMDEQDQPLNLIQYDAAKHIIAAKTEEAAAPVEGFGGQMAGMPMTAAPQASSMPNPMDILAGTSGPADLQLP